MKTAAERVRETRRRRRAGAVPVRLAAGGRPVRLAAADAEVDFLLARDPCGSRACHASNARCPVALIV
jgi:hypothetical protein